MNEFIENVAEILEVEATSLHGSTDFRVDVPDFDSMRGFALLCMFEDEYNKKISVEEFLTCNSIEDLFILVGTTK